MWQTLSSRLIYENPWIKVREDKVIAPTGAEGIYSVVESTTALGIVAVTKADNGEPGVVMVGQHRYPLDCYSIEIPEGGKKVDETPEEGITRELLEETGYFPHSLTRLGGLIHTSNCFTSEEGILFFSDNLEYRGQQGEDETERIDTKVYPISEIKKMLSDGTITDAMSIVGLYRAISVYNL